MLAISHEASAPELDAGMWQKLEFIGRRLHGCAASHSGSAETWHFW